MVDGVLSGECEGVQSGLGSSARVGLGLLGRGREAERRSPRRTRLTSCSRFSSTTMDSTQIPALKLYEGPEKLVLGIDVGTTSCESPSTGAFSPQR